MGLQEELEAIQLKKVGYLKFLLKSYGNWQSNDYYKKHYEKMFLQYSSQIMEQMIYLLSVGVSRKIIKKVYTDQLEKLVRVFTEELYQDFSKRVVLEEQKTFEQIVQ